MIQIPSNHKQKQTEMFPPERLDLEIHVFREFMIHTPRTRQTEIALNPVIEF